VAGIATSADRHWRRVPKINILPRRPRTPPVVLMLRGLLALIVVLEVFGVQNLYRAKAGSDETTRATRATLEREQRQLTAEQGSVQAIQSQLSQLQQQRDAKDQAYKEATGGKVDWHTAIATLLAVAAPEATFESVIAQEGGKIVLKGVANEAEAVATLPSKLRGTSAVLDFQSIRWEAGNPATGGNPPPSGGPIFKFTATLTVRR
jgi:Tfp pilus assembly protein PilN